MSDAADDALDPETSAQVRKDAGDTWGLIIERRLRHSPERVWSAITDPAQLREWAPFDADGSLAVPGARVQLATVNAPSPMVSETTVQRAEHARLLEYEWGGHRLRWELEPLGTGTRLTLWTAIDRRYIAMGAAGWHLCLDVMDRVLEGQPIGRLVGMDALQDPRWRELHARYTAQFSS